MQIIRRRAISPATVPSATEQPHNTLPYTHPFSIRSIPKLSIYAMAILMLPSYTQQIEPYGTMMLAKPQGFYENNYIRPHDDTVVRIAQPSILSGTVSYRSSYKPHAITAALFGQTSLPIAGSASPDYNPATTLTADYLGLAQDFSGVLYCEPRMQTITLDGFYHLDLSCIAESVYVEIGLPLVIARWGMEQHERINTRGSLTFPAGYMGAAAVPTASSIQQAMSGVYFFGDMKAPWSGNRLACESQTRTRVSDISCALGRAFLLDDRWTLRCAVLTLIPGGNKPDPTYLLTPVVGNGDHWELGASLIATFRHAWEETTFFEATCMGNVTHLFDVYETRTFDLIGRGYLSRYGLLKQYSIDTQTTPITYTYDTILVSTGNFTTRTCKVACPIQGDVTFQGTVQLASTYIDWGYNFYGRTAEHITIGCGDGPCELVGKRYQWKGFTNVIDPDTSSFLTRNDIDTYSGSAPATRVHTLFFQAGHRWTHCWGEPTLLLGTEVQLGSYGRRSALSQWGVWTHIRMRF